MLLPLRVETRLLCRTTTIEEIAMFTLDGTDTQNELIKSFDGIIMNTFFPAIFGETQSPQEKGLFALPIREGCLGIEELSVKVPRGY